MFSMPFISAQQQGMATLSRCTSTGGPVGCLVWLANDCIRITRSKHAGIPLVLSSITPIQAMALLVTSTNQLH